MNKLYLVKFDHWSYDEYDAFVVCAKDKQTAIRLIKEKHHYAVQFDTGYKVKEIATVRERIILGSYNAG